MTTQFDKSEELPLVMREIADALGARTAILTMHPGQGIPPSILFTDAEAELDVAVVSNLLEGRRLWPDTDPGDILQWRPCDIDAKCRDLMSIPVARVPGHSRLVITAFFDELTPETKANAAAVYLRRRPFAIGYFRLLQLDRARSRRMQALENALHVTELGVLMIDRSGQLAFANECGRRILTNEEGVRLDRGALRATLNQDDLRLQTVLNHVVDSSSVEPQARSDHQRAPVLSLQRRNGEPALVLSVVAPEHRSEEPGDIAAIVFIIDPSADLDRLIQPICQLYALTPVETAIVQRLIAANTIVETASALHIKEHTARAYLKTIFSKTNTHRQTELVLLILTSVVRMSRAISFQVVS